jgi:hypothetical protein
MNLLKSMAEENHSSHPSALFVVDEAHLLLYRSQKGDRILIRRKLMASAR